MKIKNKSKLIGYILGIILFIALIGGITYAIFNWRSTDTNISLDTKCFDIQGNSSYTVTGNNTNMLLFDENDILDTTNNTITYKNGMVYYPFNITRGSECNTDVYYEIIVNVTTLSNDYRNGSLKYKIIEDMSSYTSEQITNPLDEDLEYIYEGTITNTGSTQIYFALVNQSTNIIPAVVFYLDGDLVPENASNLTFSASIEVVGNQAYFGETAADYVKFLYNAAGKSTATVNSITYNLAPVVNLMNDRHASMSTDINGGDIRYYGANPNNYVWLGDTYTSSYTFSYNGSNVTRNVGDKKLWRIIGVFDGRLKLIQFDPISTTNLSWDTSANNTTGGNAGGGINQWGESTYSDTGNEYKGADLMRLLNPGFDNNQDLNSSGNTVTVNNSLYWNKGTGTVYTGRSNATTSSVSFANTGLSVDEKNMIDTVTWYTGAHSSTNTYVDSHYNAERGTVGKICMQGYNYCNDKVTRTSLWSGKVGLMYLSDYGYATDLSLCNTSMSSNDSNYPQNDWLTDASRYQWTLSTRAQTSDSRGVSALAPSGYLSMYVNTYASSSGNFFVRPAVYLKTGVSISSGIGSESDPYVLSYSG